MEQWSSRTVMVEQCGGKVEQSRWNSVVEQWNSHGGTVWWWNSEGGTVWWNKATVMVEQWDSHGATVWWNSGTVEQ